MADRCPTCNQHLPDDKPKAQGDKKYVQIPSWEAFRDLCSVLLSSPNCTDQKFREALTDFPKTLARYNQLTEGQWKFFCVIHKQVFGTWPPKAEALVQQEQAPSKELEMDQVPF